MSLYLCLETTSKWCSAAIGDTKGNVWERIDQTPNAHAEKITELISEVLSLAKCTWGSLEAVVVSEGPGSYTGLRIGFSTAKGICFAHDLPLLSVSTFKSMAHQASKEIKASYYVPTIDARREEVYTAILDNNFQFIKEPTALVLNQESIQAFFREIESDAIVLIGDGVPKWEKYLDYKGSIQKIETIHPKASDLLPFVLEKIKSKEFADVAYAEPFYLKPVYIAGQTF